MVLVALTFLLDLSTQDALRMVSLFSSGLHSYDIYYTVEMQTFIKHVRRNTGGEFVEFDTVRLSASELKPPLRYVYRSRRSGSVRRIEALTEGRPETVVIISDGQIHFYASTLGEAVLRPLHSRPIPEGHDFEEYYRNFRPARSLVDLLNARHNKNLVSCKLLDGVLEVQVRPGTDSNIYLTKQGYRLRYDIHKQALQNYQEYSVVEGKELTQLEMKIQESAVVGQALTVPVVGSYCQLDSYRPMEVNTRYSMRVDQERSRWNLPVDPRELTTLELPSGTQVSDQINNRSFVTGEKQQVKNLDKLTDQARGVLRTRPATEQPTQSHWLWITGMTASLVLFVGWKIWHRRFAA